MSRTTLNYLIDALSFTGFTLLAATGVLVRYVLPPGSGRWSTLWGLQRHDWGEIHFWIAIVFLLALSMHLFLHWSWITAFVKGHKREEAGWRVGLGLVALIALLALALAPFFSPVEQTPRPGQGRGRASHLLPQDAVPSSVRDTWSQGDVSSPTGWMPEGHVALPPF